MNTNPDEIVRKAEALGVTLGIEGTDLAIISPETATPDLLAMIKASKADLIDFLSAPPWPGTGHVPPHRLPLFCAFARPTEDQLKKMLKNVRQQSANSIPVIVWLEQREAAYQAAIGEPCHRDALAYLAARDLIAFQMRRDPAAWELWKALKTAGCQPANKETT